MTMHWPQAGQITLSTNNRTTTEARNSSDYKIQYLREEIDSLDNKFTQLLLARFALAKEIAIEKTASGKAIKDELRERELLNRISAIVGEQQSEQFITAIFREIIKQSVAFQVSLNHEDTQLCPAQIRSN